MTATNTDTPTLAEQIEKALRDEMVDTFNRSTYAELAAAVLAIPLVAQALTLHQAVEAELEKLNRTAAGGYGLTEYGNGARDALTTLLRVVAVTPPDARQVT